MKRDNYRHFNPQIPSLSRSQHPAPETHLTPSPLPQAQKTSPHPLLLLLLPIPIPRNRHSVSRTSIRVGKSPPRQATPGQSVRQPLQHSAALPFAPLPSDQFPFLSPL